MIYYYIYILQSEKDNYFYTGYTSNLRNRINDHNDGKVVSTKSRRPIKLVYFEGVYLKKILSIEKNILKHLGESDTLRID